MTAPSKAAGIADALAQRLKLIRKTAGYLTDAGLQVWQGRLTIDPDSLPSITIREDEDLVERQRGQADDAAVLLPFVIEATSPCDADNPNLAGHVLIADIKRAIFSGDLTWGGLAQRTLYTGRTIGPRQDGSDLVTVTVKIQIAIVENLARP
jgi:hypothetical protein